MPKDNPEIIAELRQIGERLIEIASMYEEEEESSEDSYDDSEESSTPTNRVEAAMGMFKPKGY